MNVLNLKEFFSNSDCEFKCSNCNISHYNTYNSDYNENEFRISINPLNSTVLKMAQWLSMDYK